MGSVLPTRHTSDVTGRSQGGGRIYPEPINTIFSFISTTDTPVIEHCPDIIKSTATITSRPAATGVTHGTKAGAGAPPTNRAKSEPIAEGAASTHTAKLMTAGATA